MGLQDSEVIILKTYGLNDADKIVVFFSEKHGLIRGVAKGAKRLKSKFGGALEPFSIVNIEFYQKEERELAAINRLELVKSYFDIISQPETLESFSYLVDLIVEFAPPHDPNENLYRMIKVCMENASKNIRFLPAVVLYFEFWLLRLCGYLPNWESCISCRKHISENDLTFLQADFHIICQDCLRANNREPISSEKRRIYQIARKYAPEEFIQITSNNSESIYQLSLILKGMLSKILNRDITISKAAISHT